MTAAKIKRGKGTTRGGATRGRVVSKSGPRTRGRKAPQSRTMSFLSKLPVEPKTVERAASWTIFGAFCIGLYAIAASTGVTAKASEEMAQAVGRAGFEVKKVEVLGVNRIDQMKIYDLALNQKNRSMASVDLDALRADLMKYGWVADARVSRRLPDTLVIDIVERTPTAVWQNQRKLSLIDVNGVVLEPVTVATMPDLPLVIGPNANEQTGALDKLLEEAPAVKPLLAGATWVGNRRWDLRFQSGETLSLPEGDTESKKALANFARMDGMNRLLGRGIVRFDMRDPDRFVLRLPEKAQAEADGSTDKKSDAKPAAKKSAATQNEDGKSGTGKNEKKEG